MSDQGQCQICKKLFKKNGLSRHLKKCMKEFMEYGDYKNYKKRDVYLLQISDVYNSSYFLYILIDCQASLKLLDDFLRGIWLECCGHLSEFVIEGKRFSSYAEEAWDGMNPYADMGMHYPIGQLLHDGLSFHYTYDFGSSTELKLSVKGIYDDCPSLNPVTLIARNEQIRGKEINSPREGVCGYQGDGGFDPAELKIENYVTYDWSESIDDGDDDIDALLFDSFERFVKDKLFKEVYKSFDYYVDPSVILLKDCLSVFTKSELYELSKELGVTGVSALNKKKLLEHLCISVQYLCGQNLEKLTLESIKLIEKAVRYGSVELDPGEYGLSHAEDLRKFIYRTMLFPVNEDIDTKFILPKELIPIFNEKINSSLKTVAKENSRILDIVKGFVYYYGAINIHDLDKMLKDLGVEISLNDLYILITHNEVMMESIKVEDKYIVHKNIIDLERFLHGIKAHEKESGPIDYKKLSLKELVKAGKEDYYVRSREVVKLEKCIDRHFEIRKCYVKDFTSDLMIFMDEMDNFNELVQFVMEIFPCPDLEVTNEIIGLVAEVYSHQRQWLLKGFSPYELRSVIELPNQPVPKQQKQEKIGRNAPCPCGSGKKYKRCCGKVN